MRRFFVARPQACSPGATAESSDSRNPHSSPPTFGLYKKNFVKFFLVHFYSPGRASTGALGQNQNFTKLHFAIVFGLFDHKGSREQKAQVIDIAEMVATFREDLGRRAGSGRTTNEKGQGQTGQGLAGYLGKDPEFHE
ncbi:hypothetical protein H9Y13_18780 [Aeromonas veronii]|uniref:hypothetical protein n=1 Tax=Aeromonas TaxID=642 RepID=UPI0022EAE335|nr:MULTISPECIES: hypothetical protein [Aeromonas]KAJ8740057.1 hypothetical protein H9Y13_18780 [Aeromonas veronii]MDA3317875.1 hypothetical protein [Aeromonas sp. PI_26]